MEQKKYLAIDIGAASGCAIVGFVEKERLITKEIHRFCTGDIFWVNGRVRNVYRWYEEILNALRVYVREFGDNLYSVGVDSMGEDFVLIGRDGEILMPPPSYRDLSCGEDVLQWEEASYGNERLYEICGNQSVSNDTLRQLMTMVLKKEKIIYRAGGLLFMGDLFHYLLCGSRGLEHSLAGYGKLYNQKEKCWENSIFESFCIPETFKGKIVYCGDLLGYVHREICEDTGIAFGTRVITPSIHDTACAAFAIPAEGEDWAFISSGSWSLAGIGTEHAVISKSAWQFNMSNSSMPFGRNMFKKLIAGMWIIQRCAREWEEYSFSHIVKLAEEKQDNEFYFDVDLPELFNPPCMTEQICRILGRDYEAKMDAREMGVIARICFESLALKYRYTLDRISEIAGREIRTIYIVGGGSKNTLLNQMTADACGRRVITGIEEAAATGNLLCQMIGAGELNVQDVGRLLSNSFTMTEYEPERGNRWEQKYENYLKLCRLGQERVTEG